MIYFCADISCQKTIIRTTIVQMKSLITGSESFCITRKIGFACITTNKDLPPFR
jgi:hypothetical protein